MARERASAESRATLLPRDVEAGFEAVLGPLGALASPEAIRTAIGGISNDDLSRLIHLLRADLAAASSRG